MFTTLDEGRCRGCRVSGGAAAREQSRHRCGGAGWGLEVECGGVGAEQDAEEGVLWIEV